MSSNSKSEEPINSYFMWNCETISFKVAFKFETYKKNLLEMTSYELFLSFFYNIITRFFLI